MRAGIVVNVTRADRHRLEAIVRDRSAPQKHVWRAQIILATAAGCGTSEIMRRSGKAKPVVWRWQERFMKEGVDGLLCDKTRKPGKPPLPAATVQKVIGLVTGPPPGETTHWTGQMLAPRSTHRIENSPSGDGDQVTCTLPDDTEREPYFAVRLGVQKGPPCGVFFWVIGIQSGPHG